ncbi:MAG: PRC-barrel domain-containing protein [Pseudomonadota bacterium]
MGLGEKEVAISVDRLNIVEDSASDERIISEYTREQLENATAFQRSLLSDDDSGMWSGTSTMREDNAGMMGQADSDVEMDMAADAEANPTPETSGEMTAEAEADMEPNVDPEDTAALDDRMFMPISEAGELKASNLIGMEVQGAGGSDVGEIGDVILSSDGAVEAIIVDVGGFLGMSEKPVAVSLENLEISQADDMSGSSIIRTGLTEPQLEGHPGYDANAYAAQRGDMLMTAPAYTE